MRNRKSPRGPSRRGRRWKARRAARRGSAGETSSGSAFAAPAGSPSRVWSTFRRRGRRPGSMKLSEVSEFTTSCNFCSCGCGMVATVRDGKLITMEGDVDHVVNRGSLCVKGISMFATHASPKRLTDAALPRAGQRPLGGHQLAGRGRQDRAEDQEDARREPGSPPRRSAASTSRSTGPTRSPSSAARRTRTRSATSSRRRRACSGMPSSSTRPDFDTAPRSPVWGPRSVGAR